MITALVIKGKQHYFYGPEDGSVLYHVHDGTVDVVRPALRRKDTPVTKGMWRSKNWYSWLIASICWHGLDGVKAKKRK